MSIKNPIFGIPSNILTGIDYYDATYHSRIAAQFNGFAPIHVYDLSQQTLAGYWQQTVGLLPTTDFSYGGRAPEHPPERARSLRSRPPRGAFDTQANPLDSSETQYALHVGFEHRLNEVFSVFGRAARAFRTPDGR